MMYQLNKLVGNRGFRFALPLFVGLMVWAASSVFYLQGSKAQDGGNDDEQRLKAGMTGSQIGGITPIGKAEYKVRPSRNRRSLEVTVSSVNLPAGTTLTVYVNNASVGQMTLSALQSGLMELETNDGDTVPEVTIGMPVAVKQGDTTIVSGNFGDTDDLPGAQGNEATAPLTGAAINGVTPFGRAKYEVEGANREFKVEFFSVNLAAGTSLGVFVDDAQVGTMSVSSIRAGEFKLETEHGQTVPNVVNGTRIDIKQGTTAILSGVFSIVPPPPQSTPTPPGTPIARFFRANLDGNSVNPPVTTTGRAIATATLNNDSTQIRVDVNFFNLSSEQTVASINGPAPNDDMNAPVIFNLGTVGGTSGFFPTKTFDVTPEQVQQLRTEQWYVTISTVNHPNGEIRGDLEDEGNDADFEGDGRAEVAVYRPTTGEWFSVGSSTGAVAIRVLGGANDINVPGDYDGDGINDIAVFHTANGVWEIVQSSNGATRTQAWGLPTDKPIVGDYDGDGRDDLTVFRSGVWYTLLSSTGSYTIIQWGLSDDKPIAGDYDGDGRTDLAIFRPSSGAWYVRNSKDGSLFAAPFGLTGDIPLSGDFDGDGRTDLTVWRPSTGIFYVFRSINNDFRGFQFGVNGDIPVTGDFDSDWRTDIAIFRPSTGVWYVLSPESGKVTIMQFGLNGDRPVSVSSVQ